MPIFFLPYLYSQLMLASMTSVWLAVPPLAQAGEQ